MQRVYVKDIRDNLENAFWFKALSKISVMVKRCAL